MVWVLIMYPSNKVLLVTGHNLCAEFTEFQDWDKSLSFSWPACSFLFLDLAVLTISLRDQVELSWWEDHCPLPTQQLTPVVWACAGLSACPCCSPFCGQQMSMIPFATLSTRTQRNLRQLWWEETQQHRLTNGEWAYFHILFPLVHVAEQYLVCSFGSSPLCSHKLLRFFLYT